MKQLFFDYFREQPWKRSARAANVGENVGDLVAVAHLQAHG
jgi:hypothetical protein